MLDRQLDFSWCWLLVFDDAAVRHALTSATACLLYATGARGCHADWPIRVGRSRSAKSLALQVVCSDACPARRPGETPRSPARGVSASGRGPADGGLRALPRSASANSNIGAFGGAI